MTYGRYILCLLSIFLTVNTYSEDETSTVESESLTNESVMNHFNQDGLNAWGLTRKELVEYKRVKQGNRKFWSPNLHPLAALGMREGVTPSERNALAEKLVHIERKRVDREIAFEKAFQAANRRLYSHIPLFSADSNQVGTKNNIAVPKKSGNSYRYYLKTPCNSCKAVIASWIAEDAQVDLFIDAASDIEIRKFAKSMGISPLLVPGKFRLHRMSEKTMYNLGIRSLPHAVTGTDKESIQ